MDPATLVDVLLFFAFLSVSAVLAAGESAFFRVKPESIGSGCDKRSAALAGMLAEPQELLIRLLVGASLSNVLIVLFALRITWRAFPGTGRTAATVVSLIIAALLVAVFARLLPKIYVGRSPQAAALNLARPVGVLLIPVYPLVKVVLVFTKGLLEARTVRALSENSVVVSGAARIADVNEALRTCIDKDGGCGTIAELVCSLAGGVPSEGEELSAEGLRFVVDKATRQRIERVLIVGEGIGRTARETEG